MGRRCVNNNELARVSRDWHFGSTLGYKAMMPLLIVTSLSFVVALSGAMAPGPLLTYTIARTVQTERRGFLVGAQVILGHSMLEAVLIAVLLMGFATVLRSTVAVRTIGTLGGLFLITMGAILLYQLVRGRLPNGVEKDTPEIRPRSAVLGGVLVSMSNPYWWIWWATVGFAFMVRYEVSAQNWPSLIAFFVGHEAGDLAWYLTVSILVYLGRRHIAGRLYRVVLGVCAAGIIGFGVFLGLSAFFYSPA